MSMPEGSYEHGLAQEDQDYTYQVCLDAGCYDLVAADSGGDGWGTGQIRIVSDGVLIVSLSPEAPLDSLEDESSTSFAFSMGDGICPDPG